VFVAFDIQHAMRMRYIVIVTWPAVQYFSSFLINSTIFEKKFFEEKNTFEFSQQFRLKRFSFQQQLRQIIS